MVDHITDTFDFEIEVIQHGDLVISNINFQTPVESGSPIKFSYDVTNHGGQDTCWGHIVNTNTTPFNEIAGTRWQEIIPSETTKHIEINLPPIASTLHGKIEVGYYTE